MFSYIKTMSFISLLAMSFVIMSCNDTTMTDIPAENEIETLGMDMQPNLVEGLNVIDAVVSGRTIGGIELPLFTEEGDFAGDFTGRITNLRLTEGGVGEDGEILILATGRIIGSINGQRINQTFEETLRVFDGAGDLIEDLLEGAGVCQILFLEVGPIFLDLLGLVVEVPDPIVVEIRAERGPGNLLGNLLCGLVSILD